MKSTLVSILSAAVLTASAARGQAPNFANYVALGDSLTAGWQSGCLVDRHQLKSYPSILAEQFGRAVAQPGDVGLAPFQQPYVSEPGIPQPCTTLGFDPHQGFTFDFHTGEAAGEPENAFLARPYSNLGIPGAATSDLLTNIHSTGTDIYSLVLRNFPGSPLDGLNAATEAIAQQPSFVTVWIGNNDILGAALSGAVINGSCTLLNQDPNGTCDGITYTPLAAFTQSYNTLLQTLRGGLPSATIAVVNIPDVTAIPFVTTLPPVVFNPATSQPVLDPQGHPIPFIGQKHDGSIGPLPLDTRVTLGYGIAAAEFPGIGIPCPVYQAATGGRTDFCFGLEADGATVNPASLPLPDGGFVIGPDHLPHLIPGVLLYSDEVALIHQRTADLNAAIAAAAASVGAKVFDVNALFNDIAAHGRTYGGVTVTASFLSGGIFSYDGFHPSNIGQALFADEFIQWLNSTYHASVPRPNVYQRLFEPDVAPSSAAPVNSTLARAANYPTDLYNSLLQLFGPRDLAKFAARPAAGVGAAPLDSRVSGR